MSRLIDANALVNRIVFHTDLSFDAKEALEDEIENAPTIEPERRKGKWIGNPRHQACSECHTTYCVPDGQDGALDMTFYNFCPHCGADMRGEQDE